MTESIWRMTETTEFDRLRDMNKRELIDEVIRLRSALEPFASIGGWLFARPLPDTDPMVTFEGINGVKWAITRGHFKAASIAYRDDLEPCALSADKEDGWKKL